MTHKAPVAKYAVGQRVEVQTNDFTRPGMPLAWFPGTITRAEPIGDPAKGRWDLMVETDDGKRHPQVIGPRGGGRNIRPLESTEAERTAVKAARAEQETADRAKRRADFIERVTKGIREAESAEAARIRYLSLTDAGLRALALDVVGIRQAPRGLSDREKQAFFRRVIIDKVRSTGAYTDNGDVAALALLDMGDAERATVLKTLNITQLNAVANAGGARTGVSMESALKAAQTGLKAARRDEISARVNAPSADVQRAQRLLDQVKIGKTIFFKAGDEWMVIGPTERLNVGDRVTVSKADGSTSEVLVREIKSERTVQGVSARTATFVPAPAEPRPAPSTPTVAATSVPIGDDDARNLYQQLREARDMVAGLAEEDNSTEARRWRKMYDEARAALAAAGRPLIDPTAVPRRRFGGR